MKISTRVTKFWSDIPDYWKKTTNVKNTDYKPKPTDEGLASILGIYAGKDDLRPQITGIYFDEKNIITTDAHRLFILPNNGDVRGLYEIGKNKKIDATFPNYKIVIPEDYENKYKINIEKLKTFCSVIINGEYCNNITKVVKLLTSENEVIAFNGQFLIDILQGFQKLGYEEVYMGNSSSKRASTFVVDINDLNKVSSSYGNRPLGLLMPVRVEDENPKSSASDIDFERELLVVYNLKDGTIIDSDGKEVKDWQPKTDWGIEYWNKEEANVADKIITKKSIPVLDFVKVKDKQLIVTNLDFTYTINGVNVDDGLYNLVNMALVDRGEDTSEYPKIGSERYSFVDSWINELPKQNFIEASQYISKDKTEEVFNGIHYKTDYGDDIVEATNQYYIFHTKTQGKPFLKIDVIVGSPILLSLALSTFESDNLKIQIDSDSEVAKIYDLNTKHIVYVRLIDQKYPDTKNIFPDELTNTINFDIKQLKELLKDLGAKSKNFRIQFVFGDNKKANVNVIENDVKKSVGIINAFKTSENRDLPKNFIGIMRVIDASLDGEIYTIEYLTQILKTATRYGEIRDGYVIFRTQEGKYIQIIALEDNLIEYTQKKEKTTKAVSKKKKTELKDDTFEIKSTIKALGYLADAGDEDAKKTIKALKILLENM